MPTSFFFSCAVAGYGVPYDLTFPVTVTNGSISILFTSVVNYAQVSAISIVPSVAK